MDIHLPDGVEDKEYLERLEGPVTTGLAAFRPDLLVYVAGADPYYDDQLGGLCLSMEGLQARDRLVVESALKAGVPVAVVYAGGYASQLGDNLIGTRMSVVMSPLALNLAFSSIARAKPTMVCSPTERRA